MALADYNYNNPTIEIDRLITRLIVFSDIPVLKGY